MRLLQLFICFLLSVFLSQSTLAQAPNDNFANAATVSLNTLVTASNVGASRELGEPFPDEWGPVLATLWWKWTPTGPGAVEVTTDGSEIDTMLSVWKGDTLASLTLVASNDDEEDIDVVTSKLTFAPIVGVTYYVSVGGFEAGVDEGEISLRLTQSTATPPVNDAFASALVLQTNTPATGSNALASLEDGERRPSDFAEDEYFSTIWWKWTAPAEGGRFLVSTAGSAFDTMLAVWTGTSLGNLVEIGSVDDDADELFTGTLRLTATGGTTYYISVGGYDSKDTGAVQLSVTPNTTPLPPNDNFADRITLITDVLRTGDASEGGIETDERPPSSLSTDRSIWYTWTAATAGYARIAHEYTARTGDLFLAIWKGDTLASLTLVHASNSPEITFPVAAGETFQISLSGGSSPFNLGQSSLLISQVPTPAIVVRSFSISPLAANTTESSAQLVATLSVAVASGAEIDGSVSIRNEDNVYYSAIMDRSNRIAGSASDGTYQVIVTVPRFSETGRFYPSVFLGNGDDQIFTSSGYLDETPLPGPLQIITLTNTGAVDRAAPSLSDLVVTPSNVLALPVGGSGEITVSARLADALSGVDYGYYTLSTAGYAIEGPLLLRSGDAANGVHSARVRIDEAAPAGTYTLVIEATDLGGNMDSREVSFTLQRSVSVAEPTLVSLSAPSATLEKAEEYYVIRGMAVRADDQPSRSISSVWLSLPGTAGITGLALTDGTAQSGTWTGVLVVPYTTPPGDYDLEVELVSSGGPVFSALNTEVGFPGPFVSKITVPQSYEFWAATTLGSASPEASKRADTDGDGLVNLVEYALGLNGSIPDAAGGQIHIGRDGNDLVLRYGRRKNLGNIQLQLNQAETLSGPWTGTAGQVTTVDLGSTIQITTRLTSIFASAANPPAFFRLEAGD